MRSCGSSRLSGTPRPIPTLIFDGVWLDEDRIVAVQRKALFAPFYQTATAATEIAAAGQRNGRG
jgi:hypothetical protein